jgi:hypothetical protein
MSAFLADREKSLKVLTRPLRSKSKRNTTLNPKSLNFPATDFASFAGFFNFAEPQLRITESSFFQAL